MAEEASEEAEVDEPESQGMEGTAAPKAPEARKPEVGGAVAPDVMLPGPPPVGRSLASMPALARQLAARTWQVVRFPTCS